MRHLQSRSTFFNILPILFALKLAIKLKYLTNLLEFELVVRNIDLPSAYLNLLWFDFLPPI